MVTTIILFLGVFFIVTGFLTRKYPWMIKEWRYANEEARKNIDIRGLQSFMFRVMTVSGVSLIIAGILHFFIEGDWVIYTILIVTFGMAGYIIANLNRYDKNPKSKKIKIVSTILLIIALLAIFSGQKENKIDVNNNTLDINGIYGESVDLNTIDTVYMSPLSEIPTIEIRTNGYAMGNVLKGFFRLTDWGKCKLIIHNTDCPVIVLKRNGKYLLINLRDEAQTQTLYHMIETH